MVSFFIEKLGDEAYSGDRYTYFTGIATAQHNEDREEQVNLLLNNGYDLKKDPLLAEDYSFLLVTDDVRKKALDAIDLGSDDGTVLIKALSNGYEGKIRAEYIVQLISKGANVIGAPEEDKVTPLHWAAKNFGDNLDLVKLLVEKGADPNAKDIDGKKPLDYAANYRPGWDSRVSDEVFKYLYKITDEYKPDIFAILKSLNKRLKIVKLLLSHNADFNATYKSNESRSIWSTNYDGYTPLQYAEEEKMPTNVIEYLRSQTKIPELTGEQEKAILHYYFDTQKSEQMANSIKEALKKGADPNVQNADGDTFLHRVMKDGGNLWKYVIEFVDLAEKNGADVNIRNSKGQTALMLTPLIQYTQRLLAAGADVNIQDNEGNTVMHYATNRYFKFLLPVLKANPDLTLKNKNGISAIDHLRAEGIYYTDGFVYPEMQEIKEAIDALGLDLPTDQQLQGLSWQPKPIDINAISPDEYTEVSSYYFPFNDCRDGLLYLGGNLLALVGGYPRVIQFFDTMKGKVIWGLNSAAPMGYAIYDEQRNVIYVARDGSSTANYITAHDPDTGKMLWKKECKLTNSREQFGTFFVQNSTHLIHANIRKGVLYFVSKDKGKLDSKLNMIHHIGSGVSITDKTEMFVHGNNLYVFGVNPAADCFTVDHYDITTQTFVETIFTSPIGVRKEGFELVGDCIYIFANSGVLYKLSLPDGKLLAQTAHDPEGIEKPASFMLRYMKRKDDKLVYQLHNYISEKDENFEYDLTSDKLTKFESEEPNKPKPRNVEYGKKDWKTIKSLVLGDSVFEIQKKSWTSDSRSCYLHRLS